MRITILIFFLIVANLNAQNNYTLNVGEVKQKKYHTTFDFQYIADKIIIDVKINNKIRKFILDTGAPTSLSSDIIAEGKFKQVLNLNVTDVNDVSQNMDAIQIPEFSINNLVFLNNYALQIEDMSPLECFKVEGIIGSNSLRNSVVEFDFKAKKITISDSINAFGYGKVNENELFFKDIQSTPILKIKMKLGYLSYSEEVIFDSGDDSFYSLSTNNLNKLFTIIKENKIPKELQSINQSDLLGIIASSNGSFSFGLFGLAKENIYYNFKIQDFVFGTTNFNNIISTNTYSNNSRIGLEILKHGKLTLDYKKKKYYFEEYDNIKDINLNHNFKSIYPSYENEKLIVGIIWDNNLKDKIKVGDEILKINDIEFNKLTKCEILLMSYPDFKDSRILNVELKDKETNEIKRVEIQN